MKKTALLLAALLTTGASLSADDAAPASSYAVTVDFPYASKYVFRGIQYAEESFQPSIKVTSGAAYAGIWTNQPVTKNIDNEIDFYAGYNFTVAQGWTLDVGGTFYYYPEADTNQGLFEHTFEAYAGLNGTVGGVTVGLYAYNDFDWEAFTLQGSVGYSIPIDDKTSCNLSAALGSVSADAGDYTYYSLGVQVPYKLTDSATVTAGLNWASHDLDGYEDNHVWFNIGLTATF
jgi:uncharacterized protein (TIGR02001 family)